MFVRLPSPCIIAPKIITEFIPNNSFPVSLADNIIYSPKMHLLSWLYCWGRNLQIPYCPEIAVSPGHAQLVA